MSAAGSARSAFTGALGDNELRLRTVNIPLRDRAATQSSARPWWRLYRRRVLLTDIVIVIGAVALALLVRFGSPEDTIPPYPTSYLLISGLIVVTWMGALGAYRSRDARIVGVGTTEYRRVVNASVIAFGIMAIVILYTKFDIARGYFTLALPLGLIGLVLGRAYWRHWLSRQRLRGNLLSRTLVVGKQRDVEQVINQIDHKPGAGYKVVGAAIENAQSSSVNINFRDVAIMSDLDGVAEAVALHDVQAVIVAGQPRGGGRYIRDLGWALEHTNAELALASRLTNVAGPRVHFRPVEGLPLMHVELPHFEGGKHVMKRAFDMVASGLALVLLSPMFLVIAAIVSAGSPGGVFFRQERVGRGGRTFRMIKFRSMVQTAEADLAALTERNEGAGLLFKVKDDPRVTSVGRVLRKYSLDEFPQLWNVLLGHMSLVGPRPPLAREVAGYESHVTRRLYIKPGLTGMWQVNGRSNLDWDESVRLDLYYVENWSLTGDLVIMWRTLKVMRTGSGAY